MIELKKAQKICPLFTNWTEGTVINKITLVKENIKFISFGKKHVPYVSKRIINGFDE